MVVQPDFLEQRDLHPKKGQLTVKTKSSPKHLTTPSPPSAAAAAANDLSSYNPVHCAMMGGPL